MTTTPTQEETDGRLADKATETEAILEEVIDTSLHTDRAHHDELGRTEDAERNTHPEEAPPSPREQPATPIDIQRVDE